MPSSKGINVSMQLAGVMRNYHACLRIAAVDTAAMSPRRASRLCLLALLGIGVAACSSRHDSQPPEVTLDEVKASRDELCAAIACDPDSIDCERDLDELIVQADANDCLEILDAWMRCVAAATECRDGLASGSDACDEEEERAEDCRKGRL